MTASHRVRYVLGVLAVQLAMLTGRLPLGQSCPPQWPRGSTDCKLSGGAAAAATAVPGGFQPESAVGAGKALRFVKGSAELRVARSAVLEPEEMTVELWAKLDGLQPEHAQLVRKLASWDKPGFLLATSQSGYGCVQFRWWDQSLRTLPDSILGTWYFGRWHHFAAACSRQRVTLYVDGVEVARRENDQSRPLAHDPGAPLRIGPEGFVGEIDELRIWARALSGAEIQANMYRVLEGKEDRLIAYWRFDDARCSDLSPNHLSFEGIPDLSARLVESGAPIRSPVRIKEHRAEAARVAKGRSEVERIARPLPPLNATIYRFATSLAGEPFGSGDCWNFVNQAMHLAGARGRDVYVFGEPVPIERAIPGDLIQFEKFSSPTFGSERHSAILWRNHGNGKITVAHQNAPPNGKNVGLWDIDVRKSTGTILFYRPTP